MKKQKEYIDTSKNLISAALSEEGTFGKKFFLTKWMRRRLYAFQIYNQLHAYLMEQVALQNEAIQLEIKGSFIFECKESPYAHTLNISQLKDFFDVLNVKWGIEFSYKDKRILFNNNLSHSDKKTKNDTENITVFNH